jgi:hypothetical protein
LAAVFLPCLIEAFSASARSCLAKRGMPIQSAEECGALLRDRHSPRRDDDRELRRERGLRSDEKVRMRSGGQL